MITARFIYRDADIKANNDPERLVLPGLVYASISHTDAISKIRVACIILGWWKWGVGIIITVSRRIK